MSNFSKETTNLVKRKEQAINDLFDEVEAVFSIIKSELEKECSLKVMRYMLMIDVFLDELKTILYNDGEDKEVM